VSSSHDDSSSVSHRCQTHMDFAGSPARIMNGGGNVAGQGNNAKDTMRRKFGKEYRENGSLEARPGNKTGKGESD